MYNPIENENYFEWLELYNPTNESINVSGWILSDNNANDTIEKNTDIGNGTTQILGKSYAIITDKGTKFYQSYNVSNKTTCLYVDDKSIGNGLGNNGDKIKIFNNESFLIDSVEWIQNYSDIPGEPVDEIEEGYTLSRINRTNNSKKDFYEGKPTPGYENEILQRGKIQINTSQDYLKIEEKQEKKVNIKIKNIGDFSDNISLIISNEEGWNIGYEQNTLFLQPNEIKTIEILISPSNLIYDIESKIIITAISEKEIYKTNEIEIKLEYIIPDLWIKKIQIFNEEKNQTDKIYSGEIIRIKAFLKNAGTKDAENVIIKFYLDRVRNQYLIGEKYYTNISCWQKYPSIIIDTKNIKSGKHKIIALVDCQDKIKEINEYNNYLTEEFTIINTTPSNAHKQIVISEIYTNSHPKIDNEYLKIYNPTNKNLNISNYYITINPEKTKAEQHKIIFLENTIINPNSEICLTEKASDYFFETRKMPDYEYQTDSDKNITNLITTKKITLQDTGGVICLKNPFNHTIDTVCYGNKESNNNGWIGKAINTSEEGYILKRNFKNEKPIDTNTSEDWFQKVKKQIGQSNFKFNKINFTGEIKTFISPDNSYKTITQELKKAEDSIYLNMYEFTSYDLCDEIINLLLKNITVNILLEGSPVGGIKIEERYILDRINNYGAKIRFIVNKPEKNIYVRYDFDHAKYLIIDNKTLIIESCNWACTGVSKNPRYGNREWGVIIRNETIADLYKTVFQEDSNIKRADILSYTEINISLPFDLYITKKTNYGKYNPTFKTVNITGNFSCIPVLSPDNSLEKIIELIDNAKKTIYIQQLYIYPYWKDETNPVILKLIEKSKKGIEIKIIMNYNRFFENTNDKLNETKEIFERHDIKVKFLDNNWSYFTNVHNKGVIVDGKYVLISSINWNENSFTKNREAGIIIINETIAKYYHDVFMYDWNINGSIENTNNNSIENTEPEDYKNTIYIVVLFTMTFAVIGRDWRKRKWM